MSNKVISIDLGATNLRVGAVTSNGEILDVIRESTTKDDASLLYAQIKRMLSEIYSKHPDVKKVGMSTCGLCEKGVATALPNLHIYDFKIKELIEKDFPSLEVTIANDANCAALVEAKLGHGAKHRVTYFITISSGIGSGLVVDGELVDLPFETGHNYIGYQSRFYEFEELCSGNGLVKLAKLNGVNVKNAAEFFSLVKNKDRKIQKAYDSWLQLVGAHLANVQLNYNTDCIILSGGVMKSIDLFLEDLKKIVDAFIAPYPIKKVNFVNATFDQDAGLLGGASLALF